MDRCRLMEQTFKHNPTLKSKFQLQTLQVQEAILKKKMPRLKMLRVEGSTAIYIPVVFHIVLKNPLLVTDT